MERMLLWLEAKQNRHGVIVTWISAFGFLIAFACALILLFAMIGVLMLINPYLAAAVTVAAFVYFVFFRKES
jgi:threonine/homoserine/homoserine lactone efflux protein